MKTTKVDVKKVTKYLRGFGVLYEDSLVFAELIRVWTENSGVEWTIQRLKGLRVEYIHRISRMEVKGGPYIHDWVARSDGVPKGILKRFWTHEYYMAHPEVVLNALRAYTMFVSSRPTSKQLEKFVKSAEKPPVPLSSRARHRIKTSPIFHLKCDWQGPGNDPLWYSHVFKVRSPGRRQPGWNKSIPETDLGGGLHYASCSNVVINMYDNNWDEMSRALPYSVLQQFQLIEARHEFVGKISFIQEPGYKLRAVANPIRLVQTALEPLKEMLRAYLERVPEDCTFDQDKGVEWCREQLATGKRLHSIDLSDATNLFPYQLQRIVLERLQQEHPDIEGYIEILDAAVSADWSMPDGSKLNFRSGQPLGLGPSFFLFALSHHSLLYALDGIGKYVILGDDIVIADDRVAKRYRHHMQNFDCVIADEKSIVSCHMAEFASRLITSTRVYRQYKWKPVTGANVLSLSREIGPSFVEHVVPQKFKPVIQSIMSLPREIGGLGYNPKGISLEERLDSEIGQFMLRQKDALMMTFRAADACVRDLYKAMIHTREEIPDEEQAYLPVIPISNIYEELALQFEIRGYTGEEFSSRCRPDTDYGDPVFLDLMSPDVNRDGYIVWENTDPYANRKTDSKELQLLVRAFKAREPRRKVVEEV